MKNTLLIVIVSLLISCKSNKESILPDSTIITDSKVVIDSVFSKSLNEYRKHTVYLPKDFDATKKYPIIFATDGGTYLTDKKAELDLLINNKTIMPLIFVASYTNDRIADSTSIIRADGNKVYLSYRTIEYLNDFENRIKDISLASRFKNHKSYFANELINHVEQKYKQNNGKEFRYFYGVSNGAGFGISLLNTNPELIGTYFCFSIWGGNIRTNIWNAKTKYPNLYSVYGTEEPQFVRDEIKILTLKYAESKSFIQTKEYQGGHNDFFWKREFINTLSNVMKIN